jgi:hypothetical protein
VGFYKSQGKTRGKLSKNEGQKSDSRANAHEMGLNTLKYSLNKDCHCGAYENFVQQLNAHGIIKLHAATVKTL